MTEEQQEDMMDGIEKHLMTSIYMRWVEQWAGSLWDKFQALFIFIFFGGGGGWGVESGGGGGLATD